MNYERMWTNLKEGLSELIDRRPELEEGITAAMCLMDVIEILDEAVETDDFKGVEFKGGVQNETIKKKGTRSNPKSLLS